MSSVEDPAPQKSCCAVCADLLQPDSSSWQNCSNHNAKHTVVCADLLLLPQTVPLFCLSLAKYSLIAYSDLPPNYDQCYIRHTYMQTSKLNHKVGKFSIHSLPTRSL